MYTFQMKMNYRITLIIVGSVVHNQHVLAICKQYSIRWDTENGHFLINLTFSSLNIYHCNISNNEAIFLLKILYRLILELEYSEFFQIKALDLKKANILEQRGASATVATPPPSVHNLDAT